MTTKNRRSKNLLWMTLAAVAGTGLVLINDLYLSDDQVEKAHALDTTFFAASAATYDVEIRRTAGGIPHIKAEDFASLGYGTGYAVAEDNICLLAKNFLRFQGELSRYFGQDQGNLESDFLFRYLIDTDFNNKPVAEELAALYRGYAAGYNRYLRDVGVDSLPDPSCRGAEWVMPIAAEDIRRIDQTPFYLPMLQAMIVAAKPPAAGVQADAAGSGGALEEAYATLNYLTNPDDMGSNGVGLGREVTAQGRGLLVANPHWQWIGSQRFYPRHQTIPGVLNILGAHSVERPLAGLGTTEHVAWTITVSTAKRALFYQLQLAPDNPTQYVFDGEVRHMQAQPVEVTVKRADGSLEIKTHTFYRTHFGFLVGQFPWSHDKAFAVSITHENGRDVAGGALDILRAKSVRELKAVHDYYQYLPANLTAADDSGEALYADPGPIPYLTDAQLAKCTVDANTVLDGSRSACQPANDLEAAANGILAPAKQPFLYRTDYVTNSNDSYWLANPAQPLNGYPSIIGSENSPRTLRTRSGLSMIAGRIRGSDGLDGNKFDIDNMLQLLVSNQSYAGQLLRDDVVTLCRANPEVQLEAGRRVNLADACEVLENWDLTANIDSRGAHLFREFMFEANGGDDRWRWLPTSFNYTVPFDLSAPVSTPRGLDTSDNPQVLTALARAVARLQEAGIPLDAKLGDLQALMHNGRPIPLHGGPENEGIFNKLTASFAGEAGYPKVTGSSSSWMSATEFTGKGPVVKGLLTYGMTTNTASSRYLEQTEMYAHKQWLDIPFREEDVVAATQETLNLSEGPADCKNGGWQAFALPAFGSEHACDTYLESLRAQRVTDFVDRPVMARLAELRTSGAGR